MGSWHAVAMTGRGAVTPAGSGVERYRTALLAALLCRITRNGYGRGAVPIEVAMPVTT